MRMSIYILTQAGQFVKNFFGYLQKMFLVYVIEKEN